MQMRQRSAEPSRRQFLQLLAAGAMGLAAPGGVLRAAPTSGPKPLHGIFPIALTPFTEDNQLDLEALAAEVRFIDRGRVHGFVWPQLASEWSTLTERERFEGMDVIASTGKPLRPAVVLGVQGPDVAAAVRYAKHAETLGADAIISLPPSEESDPQAVLEYYQEVGKATTLPLFVQAVGKMSVELILDIYRTVPTMRYVKDEAGDPLTHIGPLRERSADQIKVFSGAHGRKLLEEMPRGFSGTMPAASFADLYAATWDLWHEGKKEVAAAMHARTLKAVDEMLRYGSEGMKYVVCLSMSCAFAECSRRAASAQGEVRASLRRGGSRRAARRRGHVWTRRVKRCSAICWIP
jgi:dihydrodipicolinate synthase/N-acetylneuraminate lyase